MKTRTDRRSRLYVSHEIQGGALLKFAQYWAAYHVALYCALFLQRYLQYRSDVLYGVSAMSLGEFHAEFVRQNSSLVLCALFVFPLVAWDMLRLTHRVAGPLYRFRQVLEALARGERVQSVRLRKGDLCRNLEQAFDEYLATLDDEPAVRAVDEDDVLPVDSRDDRAEESLLSRATAEIEGRPAELVSQRA